MLCGYWSTVDMDSVVMTLYQIILLVLLHTYYSMSTVFELNFCILQKICHFRDKEN